MQLYPHWLDGEFVRIASNATGPRQDVREMIRALKLHALLGTRFVLNDVQIFDSAAVLALFSDAAFRKFVSGDTSFLDLKVKPDPSLGESAYALAARGFTRTRAPGWISSVFADDPTPIKRFADEIIEDIQGPGEVDPESPSRVAQDYPEYEVLFQAARHAVHYFGLRDKPQRLKSKAESTTYYKVLCDLRENPRLEDIYRPGLEDTLDFIDHAIEDPDARHARARVHAVLGQADRLKRDLIWNNVVQAWNYATQQTLRPEGGSAGTLPGVVSPAPYLDTPTDILVPIGAERHFSPIAAIADPPLLPCDLDNLSWTEIAAVREGTDGTLQKLRAARRTGDIHEVSQPLREHLEAATRILRPPKVMPKSNYVLMIGTVVIAAFGASPLSMVLPTAKVGYDSLEIAEQWRKRRALTNTLFRAAMGQPE